ncbi:hypothetical protein [Syntrophothermus sp.]|nr:hypothetical protein [Syntrophothermus sp.]
MKRMIAAFAGKNKDFGLYLLAMRTWLNWERSGATKKAVNQ